MQRDRAVFSIFRGTAEMPLYRVEKARGDGGRPVGFSVVGLGGCILARGPELKTVLRVLERKLIMLVE